ncbi:MFS transporter [Kibdelosporangium philippinense]|uniref:MFS transporter n=1 Tax=Kibdelosporangium philippinense TaxID=211113 RepID=A0ABS8Z7Q8_9PSEU|nr:MFS transporter [Kibdelosporangium philippinense]MCE7002696.1 MFS transporter [Kibdelosporangium philippinense]
MRARISAPSDFAKLWTASAVSNIGDGVTIAAGPLLVAQLTENPAWVAGAAFMQQLPWLLFALIGGAYADRVDRRKLVVQVNVLRGLALAALAATTAAEVVTIPIIYTIYFLLGLGETFADTAVGAMLPVIVPKEKLASANAKLMATFTIGNQFLAKPLGAWLFITAAALPFAFDAVSFLIAAALIAGIAKTPEHPKKQADVKEGIRWLMNHRVLKTLAITMSLANVVFCAAFAIFVLYAQRRLGLSEVGYGFLLTTFAIGGLIGTTIAPRLQRKVPNRTLLRTGLIVETLTHLTLAITDNWLL